MEITELRSKEIDRMEKSGLEVYRGWEEEIKIDTKGNEEG